MGGFNSQMHRWTEVIGDNRVAFANKNILTSLQGQSILVYLQKKSISRYEVLQTSSHFIFTTIHDHSHSTFSSNKVCFRISWIKHSSYHIKRRIKDFNPNLYFGYKGVFLKSLFFDDNKMGRDYSICIKLGCCHQQLNHNWLWVIKKQ